MSKIETSKQHNRKLCQAYIYYTLLLVNSPLEDKCRKCGRNLNCNKMKWKGKVEISRLNFESEKKVNCLVDFSNLNVVSCILHISDLRKHHFSYY